MPFAPIVPADAKVVEADEERMDEAPCPPPIVEVTVVVGTTVIVAPDERAEAISQSHNRA